MNYAGQRELVHLVAEHDRAAQAGEMKEAGALQQRLRKQFGYILVDGGAGQPRLVKE